MEQVRVADYVFSFVEKLGCKAVFLVPGGGAMHLNDALVQNTKIAFVPNHHEQASSIAAEAYSRVSEQIGVALVTTGPGATNAITGATGAWIESVPLLIISGQVKRADMKGDSGVRQKGPQEVDIISMVKPITKYAVTVMDPAMIRYHLEEAIHHAMSGRRGPVWLDIPLDVQAAKIGPSTLKGFSATITVAVNAEKLDGIAKDILERIQKAKRPLLMAGHGVRLSGAAKKFMELYEKLGIPVITTWNSLDLIPAEHKLSVGHPGTVAMRPGNFAVQNCDLLLSIGARLDNVVTAYNPDKFGRNAYRIMVDIDPRELNKFDKAPDMRVEANADDFIQALLRQAQKAATLEIPAWLEQCNTWKKRYPIAEKPFPSKGQISHFHLVKALSEEIPEDTLIVTGSSGLSVEAFYMSFANKRGQRVFLTSGLGAMGYALPAILGASMAAPGRSIVSIEGDGSFQMNLQELATISQFKIPVRLFIFNNNGYTSIRNTQANYFEGRYIATGPEAKLMMPDIVKLAAVYGIPAIRIDDAADLKEKVRYALAQPGPFICDVRLPEMEALWPRSSAVIQPDGSMMSMPLEDMTPLLPRDELKENMLVPLDPASEKSSAGIDTSCIVSTAS